MRLCLVVLFFLLVHVSNVAGFILQCRDDTLPNFLMSTRLICDVDSIARCGCGSWCGLAGPPSTDDIEPKCFPKSDTPDAPPPRPQGGNPCNPRQCAVRPFSAVKCPNSSQIYTHVGATCNRASQSSPACLWQLPYCTPIWPPKDSRCPAPNGCADQPFPVQPSDAKTKCEGFWSDYHPHYECLSKGDGNCYWNYVPCPSVSACPTGVQARDSFACSQLSCKWQPQCAECAPRPSCNVYDPNIQRKGMYCGGCNCVLSSAITGSVVCANETFAKPFNYQDFTGIQCLQGYTFTPTPPYCVPSSPPTTCNPPCADGETCFEMASLEEQRRKYIFQCHPTPRIPSMDKAKCSDVVCSEGFRCEQKGEYWECVPGAAIDCTGRCTNAQKTVCWNGELVGIGCFLRNSGQCEPNYQPCPDFNVPPTGPNNEKNCQVAQWTPWKCPVPCGRAGRKMRSRGVLQYPTSNVSGVQCPNLYEVGDDCVASSVDGCTQLPAGVGLTSPFVPVTQYGLTPTTGFVNAPLGGFSSNVAVINPDGSTTVGGSIGGATGGPGTGAGGVSSGGVSSGVTTGGGASSGGGVSSGGVSSGGVPSGGSTGGASSGGGGALPGGSTGGASNVGPGTGGSGPGTGGSGPGTGGSGPGTGGNGLGTGGAGGTTATGSGGTTATGSGGTTATGSGNPQTSGGGPNALTSGTAGGLPVWAIILIVLIIILIIIVVIIVIVCCCKNAGKETV